MILSATKRRLRAGQKRWPANEDHRMALCMYVTNLRRYVMERLDKVRP